MAELDAAVEASVLALDSLELEGVSLKPLRCYKIDSDRVSRYSEVAPGLQPDTVVAVVCESNDGSIIETIVDSATGEHFKFEDPIMYTEISIPSLVECQFESGGAWVLSRGTAEGIENEKGALFSKYAAAISEDPPGCLATLRRMLQAGPINTVFTGGGNGKFVKPHEGFALRMPPEDIPNWQAVNDKGELVDVPRPALALRVWQDGEYRDIDPFLHGAPRTPEDLDAWFVGVVRKLKASEYVGGAVLDRLACSERTLSLEPELVVEGHVQNHWTELVLATNP